MTTESRCKDCLQELLDGKIQKLPKRPAKEQGPRCSSHWRAEVKRRKAENHEKWVMKTYGLERGQYAQLYTFQGGRCSLCRRSTGAAKRLAVDHDHATGAPRSLACGPCNKWVLGYAARDSIAFFRRAIAYLEKSPYQRMLDGDEFYE